jgi:hypothetical protein
MLGPQDVGHRVVVRHVVGERDGRPLLTDVLGELVSLSADDLVVAGRNGPRTVRLAAIVAAKRIPPKPPRREAMRPER